MTQRHKERKFKRIGLRVPADLHRRLRMEAAKHDTTIEAITYRALTTHLKAPTRTEAAVVA